MNRYLFDTNLLLLLLRQDARWDVLQGAHNFDESFNFISVVSLGELYSIGLQNNWGIKRLAYINQLQEEFVVADIHVESIIQKYAEIDAFSQSKLAGKPLGITARNMGKNDLWIAVTASVLQLKLFTTDRDFDHLAHDFIDLERIDLLAIGK
jgi:predicted nucleic acid-binding protein